MLNNLLIWAVSRRLARCRKLGDAADGLADQLVALLAAELERRSQLVPSWDFALRLRERVQGESPRLQ